MKRISDLRIEQRSILWILLISISTVCIVFMPESSGAEESLCAVVKIEIQQELTLERQAFDAHMRINNGLSHLALENVNITISFTNDEGALVLATSDPDDTSASFYFREDSKTNINDIHGNGTVAPSTSADVHWLIVPAPGASNGLNKGKLYFVGATLTYTLGGEMRETIVSPDSILVKPMPQLVLDYFLPMEVYGDDAFTDAIEPSVPFTLGVRVKNNGRGTARDLKIESAQPKITENEQGLLIGFSIEKSQINGEPAKNTLLADFGDIGPEDAAIARWLMACSLSGRFISFNADFSHSDELGGALTSLIETVQTHFLVRDVKIDLPGRDEVLDFLAKDGDRYRVYESDGVDTKVDNPSASSSLAYAGYKNSLPSYTLTLPANQGFVFVQLPDPFQGKKIIHSTIRKDGKFIKQENVWLSKSREDKSWKHFINLFDVDTPGQYTVFFDEPASIPEAPLLQFIADVIAIEGERVTFVTLASDPDGTTPNLLAAPLPAGASFIDNKDGTALFDWNPAIGQAGSYTLTVKASDGVLEARREVKMIIRSITDIDGDGMKDAWEMEVFGTMDRGGSGDFDQDNLSDLAEYLSGSDPTAMDHAPAMPKILTPASGETVPLLAPELEIENSTDPDNDPIFYTFELYEDEHITDLVFTESDVSETANTTAWSIPAELMENGHYFWRVRASDGYSFSQWTYGDFYVNATDDPPGCGNTVFPMDGSEVDSLAPMLQVSGISDPDRDSLSCSFEIYDEMSMNNRVAEAHGVAVSDTGCAHWLVDASLNEGVHYFWQATVTDEQGLQTQTATNAFTINTTNHAPTPPTISFPGDGQEIVDSGVMLTVENALDLDGDAIFYRFDIDTAASFDTAGRQTSILIAEGPETTSWKIWDLKEDTTFFWRVRATDTTASSPWVKGSFFVNKKNNCPRRPVLKNPGRHAWVEKRTPDLCIAPGVDPDGDALSHRFEVYMDPGLENLVAWGETFSPTWRVPMELIDRTLYYWRVRSVDEHGAEGNWMEAASFFVSEGELPLPDQIEVKVLTDNGAGLEGIRIYAFTASGSYTGVHTKTGPEGAAIFEFDDLAPGAYRFRADYLGSRFWSDVVTIFETTALSIVIEEEPVTVFADTASGPVADARVYLFSESGQYLGLYEKTDANGQVVFSLPTGQTFLFRTDILGHRYWSDKTTVKADATNKTVVDAGGGRLQLVITQGDTEFLSGIKTYLFTIKGNYLGVSRTTNEAGTVAFDLPEGAYNVRVDYLGNKFWSDEIQITADTFETIVIDHLPSLLTVQGSFQGVVTPSVDVKTYLFSSKGSYLGKFLRTDAEGQALFDLPEKEFKIRADVLGGQYWSAPFVCDDPVITIPMAEALVSVSGSGHPKEGARVYVFSPSGAYLGIHGETDSEGNISFRLPEGSYDFRVDYQGKQFWARTCDLAADEMTDVSISVGGGKFKMKVQKDTGSPLASVKCHVFSEKKTYLGLTGTTDEQGAVGFDLAEGAYTLRVDYLGNSFWKEEIQVVRDMESALVIDHQSVTIRAIGDYQGEETPYSKVPVHLFSPAGSYLGLSRKTDERGQLTFDLPERSYVVRIDAFGGRYWSDPFTWADTTVEVDQGQVVLTLTRSGETVGNANVFLFNESDRYLGVSGGTGIDGTVGFTLPEGSFRFRSNANGQQQWTEVVDVEAHTEAHIEVMMDETVAP